MNSTLSARERHDLESALFRIRHINTMLSDQRPQDDFTPEILESFSEAIDTVARFIERSTDK